MANQAYPSVDGVAVSWADIQVTASIDNGGSSSGGVPLLSMLDIAAIKWGRKVEPGEQRGASGGRIMKRTVGQGSQEASWTLYRSGVRTLLKNLMKRAPVRGNQVRISLVSFDIVVQHTPIGDPEIYETIMKGCRYLGDDDDMKEGSEADKIEIALNPIEIANIINGQEVVLL